MDTWNHSKNSRTTQMVLGAVLFTICFMSRVVLKVISGYNNFELFGDSYRYNNLSDRILNGNGDMDIVAYLSAPLYPYTLALIKYINAEAWQSIAVGFQFFLVSLSAVYIYKITVLLTRHNLTAIIAALLYTFYPMTMWYNFTLAQETTFQAYFIFFIYYFLNGLSTKSTKDVIGAACFWALAFLTKSHIIILAIPILIIFIYKKMYPKAGVFFIIAFFWTIPHGIINLKSHGVYTLSSHGNASLFLLGHSDDTYPCLIRRAGELGNFSADGCNPSIVFDKTYNHPTYGMVNLLSVKERNAERYKMASDWIKSNPDKFVRLKLLGFARAIMPGLDPIQFKFSYWLASFFFGLIIYVPGYLILYKKLKAEFWTHFLSLSIVLLCAAIFIVFFPVNRFRVITMEPLLCVYAAVWYADRFKRLGLGKA